MLTIKHFVDRSMNYGFLSKVIEPVSKMEGACSDILFLKSISKFALQGRILRK